MSDGGIDLTIDGDGVLMSYRDSQGKKNPRSNGFRLAYFHYSPDGKSFIVIYSNDKSGVAEHYLFKFNDRGFGKVVWGTIRDDTSNFATKSSLMVSTCKLSGGESE